MALKNVIGLSVVFITIYALSVMANFLSLAVLLVSISPVVILWLAYRTLTDKYEAPHNFRECFYEDYEYQRNTNEG